MLSRVAGTANENQNPFPNAFLFCSRQDSNRRSLIYPKEDCSSAIQKSPSSDSDFLGQKSPRNSKIYPVLTEISSGNGSFSDPSVSTGSNSFLKRKRPPSLQIPAVLREIPATKLSCRDKVNEDSIGYDGVQCGVFCKKGKKEVMEDTHKIVADLPGNPKKGFFGVYDGHGGREAAEFVADNLHQNIFGMLEKCGGDLVKEDAIKAGYLKTDQEFLKLGISSGACCVTALIEENNIAVSNLGDCRAVLCRGGIAEALTVDHRAGREDERSRMEAQGGYVDIHHGTWRVQGVLAVSRSIGDLQLKEWVLGEPDTRLLPLTPDMEFLIMASDGLFEKVSNQEAIDIARSFRPNTKTPSSKCVFSKDEDEFGSENSSPPLKMRRICSSNQQRTRGQYPNQENGHNNRSGCSGGLMEACKELVNLAVKRGSLDDVTVMIIDLKHFLCN